MITVMRYIGLSLVLVCWNSTIWADETKNKVSTHPTAQVPAKSEGVIKLDTSSLEKTIKESTQLLNERVNTDSKEKKQTDQSIVQYTEQLANYTESLSDYTLWLVIATVVVGVIGILQFIQLKRTVDIAVTEAQPVLSPYVVNMIGLHPLNPFLPLDPFDFTSSITFSFENYGKSPGMVREVRADLFVTETDAVPRVNASTLPIHRYDRTIAGNTTAEDLTRIANVELKKPFSMPLDEFNEVLSEASQRSFRRFFLVGQVIYDDYYGIRHTNKFCIKLRLMGSSVTPQQARAFQNHFGGPRYNNTKREKIPRTETIA